MKIVLVTPPLPVGAAHRFSSPAILRRGMLPPLGILYLAGVLEAAGHEARIIDGPFWGYDEKSMAREIVGQSPGVVGISVMSPNFPNACILARELKSLNQDLKIVMGGPHPTGFPLETMKRATEVDALVVGEGELVFPMLIEAWEKNKPLDSIPAIFWRAADGEIRQNPPYKDLVNLEELPLPARHLVPITSYAPEPMENNRLPSTSVIASRGCLYAKCTFCFRTGSFWRKYRIQSPQKTLGEVRTLVNDYGIKEIIFYDDDLMSNKRWIIQFCDLLDAEKFDIVWTIRGRVDTVTFETLKRARDSGCRLIEFGFESGSQELLDRIKKGITLEQSRQAMAWCRELGIDVFGTFIMGLPGETPAAGDQTVRFAIELDPAFVAFIPCHPFPGTELYEDAMKSGKLVKPPYSERMESTRYIPSVSYLPQGYNDIEELDRLWKGAYKRFYLRPKYILRHLVRVRSVEDVLRYFDGLKIVVGLGYK